MIQSVDDSSARRGRYAFLRVAPVIAFLCGLILGCGREGPDMTRTERQRLVVDTTVQRFLFESQGAFEAGSYLAALALTDSAEKYAPDLADVHFLRGSIYTDLSRFDIAEKAYEATLELDPEYPGAYMNIGVNYARRGLLRDAIEAYRKEEALSPNSNLYLELGRAYAKLGEADSAKIAYERAIALDSSNASALMWLGQLHEELGDFETALEYSRRGASLRPDDHDYQYIIGSQLFRMGSVEEAVTYLRPVADARPWHHGAQYNMGQALMRMGEEEQAREYLAQADTAQQLQQEINDASEAIRRAPEDIQNWIRLSEAHRSAGMNERATDALRSAVAMDPGNLALQTNLATLMLESGDTEGAVQRYQTIVRIDSTLTGAWLNLGVAHGNAGNFDDAAAAWETVLRLEPGNEGALAYLAQLRQLHDG